jgi:PIN domain nuclease of toxin-antitoxin system
VKLLLDTHALLWLVDGNRSLSDAARVALSDSANELFLSVASVWELAIKTTHAKQPLILNEPLDIYLAKWTAAYQLTMLSINAQHALRIVKLPHHHRDPFDRILVAQALVEGMTLVSTDDKFAQYQVTVLW